MTPRSLVLVQLPKTMVLSFFPQLLSSIDDLYGVSCSLSDDVLATRGSWNMVGLHLLGRTMSAHEVLAAISVRPERLPSGLGILAVPLPIEQRSEIGRLCLVDTLVQTLERMVVPHNTLTTRQHQDWFVEVAT